MSGSRRSYIETQQDKKKKSAAMSRGGRRLPAHVTECLKIAIEVELNRFMASDELEISFPSTLTNQDRKFIHEYVRTKGLTSKSHGKATRILTVYKPNRNVIRKQKYTFAITQASRQAIYNLLGVLPVTPQEEAEVKTRKIGSTINRSLFNVGTLTNGHIVVPPAAHGNAVRQMRRNLPIFKTRTGILDTIRSNQVVVIVSETGSGKTTQVSQYLLEEATERSQQCRIVCTQPRRLAALSVADRVAYERGEQLGNTVGYQIRLESQTSPTSNLIYCTNGILVRCLMGGHYVKVFENITHVIVDEVHERDKHSDFLLISLKEAIAVNPHLKVILMSATIDSQLFSQYFDNCAVISIPGRLYEVTNCYLEHVLAMTEYCKKEVERKMQCDERDDMRRERAKVSAINGHGGDTSREPLDEETVKLIDECLKLCWMQCDDDSFQQFVYLVAGESVPIDFRHTETDMTALMIAAGRGIEEFVETLLQMGANPNVTSSHGMKAIDWARRLNHEGCVALLEAAALRTTTEQSAPITDEYTDILLETYGAMRTDEDIDHKLLFALITMIHTKQPPGSILVFLPGYESILRQNEMILDAAYRSGPMSNLRIYMLHSNMKINDQKAVFAPTPPECRKIILSTNIAETSITIDDVVYVIDCGKVKQTIFDAVCGTTALETTWISQACAKQRAGRAGRVTQGVCYKLYSLARYASMDQFTVPELLRVPLTEICLSAKLIAPQCPIEDFLKKALQPPAAVSVKRSVSLLKTMGALDEQENITDLGIHLADLPIDAHLGKMVMYSILMKCVDPILTVVSALSVRDPFVLPTAARDRARVFAIKERFAENSLSDHMILIRIFQEWLTHSARGPMKRFCEENFLSSGSMMTICGVRTQILGHLRANGLIKSKGKGNIHDLNQNSRHWVVVKACLVAGLYPNICMRDAMLGVLRTEGIERVLPHPHGILGAKRPADCKAKIRGLPTDWVAFEEKIRVGRSSYISCNSVVTPATVALFAGDVHIDEDANLIPVEPIESDSDRDSPTGQGNEVIFRVNRDIEFTLVDETAYLMFHLRQKLNYLLLMLVQKPDSFHFVTNGPDGKVLETIVGVLLAEEKFYRLPIPEGIGERPQGMSLDFSANVNYGIQEESRSSKPIQWNLSDAMKGMTITPTRQVGKRDEVRKRRNSGQKKNTKGAAPAAQEVPQRQPSQQQPPKSKETRYFLIKAISTEQVKHVLCGNEWCFNMTVFNYLQQCIKENPNLNVMVIFHVGAAQKFFCMGQLVQQKRGQLRVVPLLEGSMSFRDVREMVKRQKATCFMWNDGEELSREMGELFRQHLATHH